ncbi:hypothetical protein N9J74_01665 [Candidatus Pelagibacter sp.]|nr:hypothetical protein [Candidatus Pelagibacter sp.]
MEGFNYDNFIIRPVKISEIENFRITSYEPKLYNKQKKFINWAYRSPFKGKFTKESELTIMAAIDKNFSQIKAVVGFIPTVSFVKNKELKTIWDIEYFNNSSVPGLALKVLENLKLKTDIYCGNNLNNKCYRSYKRVFDKKNFKSEVKRKIAIIDSVNCNKIFNPEKNLEKLNFFTDNESKIKNCKTNQVHNLTDISDKYWEDHIKRFVNSSDRRKNYLEWRFLQHPYMKYNILSLDSKANKGLAIVRIEKIKNCNFNALRVLDLFPVEGFESDILNLVLNFGKVNDCIFADFFCSSEKKTNEICFGSFIDFEKHRKFDIPYRLQPPEVIEKKSFNLFINFNNDKELKTEEFYSTKTDGEMDLYFDQSGGSNSNIG